MAPVLNRRIILKEHPKDLLVPGKTTALDTSQIIDLDNVPLNGGVLLKILVLSLDPYLLAMMKDDMPALNLKYRIGEPIQEDGIGVVLRSESSAFQVGDHLNGWLPFQEYLVQHELKSLTKIDNVYNLPWSFFVGAAGIPGRTAYVGWKEYSRANRGDVVFVSSGAGAVGSFVIQLAKRDGLKVIASAGSDEKVQFMKELGADVAFNYKTTRASEILSKEGPINIYWDNVGGEMLEAALNAAAKRARFIACGVISAYGGAGKSISNMSLLHVVIKEISITGFIIHNLSSSIHFESFKHEVPALLASKDIIHRENIAKGLENAEIAFYNFFKGSFIGKSVVIVADE